MDENPIRKKGKKKEKKEFNFAKHFVLLFPEDLFVIANSADPGEMPPYAAFYLGLHCLL